jgi:hypothetical protein
MAKGRSLSFETSAISFTGTEEMKKYSAKTPVDPVTHLYEKIPGITRRSLTDYSFFLKAYRKVDMG